ncbi:Guanine nucleotide-binding protein-like 3-like protein [Nosema granulosis]|uniref:Guanine nucleotide-binding protein-like 3-like protein n=1 Tax=Nosema granulosis TaxID=83296 RepID=A0A9P6GX77_9MICR|nr:Guanine nucleotide-binding protein-like 3-like protein [Nosema granulosis]
MIKKRQSRRLSSRKKHNIEKKVKNRAKKQAKLKKKENSKKIKLPKNVLLADEDLELLKSIKEQENLRRSMKIEEEKKSLSEEKKSLSEEKESLSEEFKMLVDENDLIIEVLDPRDPIGSRNPKHEEYIKERGKELVVLLDATSSIPIDSTKRIGIFGQKNVGKTSLYKRLVLSGVVDKNIVRTECTHFDIISLFRNAIPLESIFYRKLLGDFFNSINRDEFSLYLGIPFFDTYKELEEILKHKYKTNKPHEIILKEFHNGNIKFRRTNTEIILEYPKK